MKKNKMLYLGPSGIGDWCFIYPSVPSLLKKYNCQKMTVMLPYQNAGNELLAENPLIEELLYLKREKSLKGFIKYGIRWIKLLIWVRKQKFDVICISYLSNQADFLLLALISGVKTIVGSYVYNSVPEKLAISVPVTVKPGFGKVEGHAAYSDGRADKDVMPPLFNEAFFDDKLAIISHNRLPSEYIVLGIGGGRDAEWRFWPPGHYASLINSLPDIFFVLLGGGMDDEKQAEKIMNKVSPSSKVLDLVGKTSVKEAICIIKNAKIVIGNDSGIANIGAVLSVPLLCIYGPTNERTTGPSLLGGRAVCQSLQCRPCFNDADGPAKVKQCEHKRCLTEIVPEHIAEYIKKY